MDRSKQEYTASEPWDESLNNKMTGFTLTIYGYDKEDMKEDLKIDKK